MLVEEETTMAVAHSPEGALTGLRVIDCTHVIAGAWCSMILADLGADVIKVEGPQGDVARATIGTSGYNNFPYVNRNKRAVTIDLSDPRGCAVLRKMLEKADIFVENYRPGAMDKMGLGYNDIRKINPGIIYCSISGFGSSGPYQKRGGLDLVTQAMSGIMSFTGEVDRGPLPCPIPISDLNAGTYGAIGVLAALAHRHKTGEGQRVETSLLETAFAYTVNQTGEYLMTGKVPTRVGSRGAYTTPYEGFSTLDGNIVIGAGTESLWRRTAEALDISELLRDTRFQTVEGRLNNHAALRSLISAKLAKQKTDYWLEKLGGAGVPVSAINTVADAMEDPQIQHLGAVVEIEGERHLRTPINLSQTPVAVTRGAPSQGQHSIEILAEFGFSDEEILELTASAMVRQSNIEKEVENG